MNVEELTKKFKEENKDWNLDGVIKWMTTKKQIPAHVADFAIKAVLLEMDGGLEIENLDRFDNHALEIARKYVEDERVKSENLIGRMLNQKVDERLAGLYKRMDELENNKKNTWGATFRKFLKG